MKFEYLTNIPLDTAVSDYMEFIRNKGTAPKTERIKTAESLGRITAGAVYAKICSPHYNASAMDGIALKASLTFGATETTPVRLGEEDFIRIDTGDPVPEGCDCVVMIEDVVEEGGGIMLYSSAAPWQHIRQIGEDISAGDMILPSYTKIEPAAIGAMLAGGVAELEAVKRPVVGIIPTGDEVVPPSDDPGPGDVMEFNSSIFSGMLSLWGALPRVYPITPDRREDIENVLKLAVSECDAVLLCAGTSAGRDDYTTSVIKEIGEILYHGIAIKPGKPAVLGCVGSIPVLGVPGYPVSGIIVLEELFKPVAEYMLGIASGRNKAGEQVEVRLSRRLVSSLKYREFVRARLSANSEGELAAVPLSRGAGVVTSFVKADCILDIPQDLEGAEAGSPVRARLLRPYEEIVNTLGIIGSHDPLLDEAADIMRRENRELYVSSSHVGSMGGIMAVKRGEAPMGGIHLLDEETGEYNISYIEKYFPDGGVVLLECVQRVQGLMVAPGNPKGIAGFGDLAQKGLSYVNRQKGSGTRLLCDFLLRQHKIEPALLYGYEREEFTHTAVAAQIAAGTADAGLGIYAAAKIYGLDFIPVCDEQYDLLLSEDALGLPQVLAFIDTLKSAQFRSRLERLGGYVLKAPGTVRKAWPKRGT